MKRNNIALRLAMHVAHKKQVELDDRMQAFLRYVIRIRQRRHYPLSMIGNMDEIPVYVDIPGNYTLERKVHHEKPDIHWSNSSTNYFPVILYISWK